MYEPKTLLAPLLERLMSRIELSPEDKDAVVALPQSVRALKAGAHLIREGDRPTHCCLMTTGFTVRYKIVADGARQILAVHMQGEMVDLQHVVLDRSDHGVQVLTEATIVTIPRTALEELVFARPSVGKALWLETLVDASVFREWIANVGQRDARTRLAHLLCEFAVRVEAAGLAAKTDFVFPMTQEQIADTVALTSVHVNRMLMSLAKDGLIEREHRSIRINDWKTLAREADFDLAYLHLPRGRATSLQ